jgi:uncharacterized radical SAM superfamily protein
MEFEKDDQLKVDLGEYFKEVKKKKEMGVDPLITIETPAISMITKLLIKLSGGKIKNEREASSVLVAVALFVVIIAIVIFLQGRNVDPAPGIDTLKNAPPPVISRA